MLIRPAAPSDAPLLPRIEISSGEAFRQWPGLEWIADDTVQTAEQHLAFIATGLALVAEEPGGKPVGFLNAEFAEDALHIWQMAVAVEHQGRGIGRRLLSVAEAAASTVGVGITLTTFREVPWNEPFYQKNGFRTLGPDDLNARLRGVLEAEAKAGLPASRRCAMKKTL